MSWHHNCVNTKTDILYYPIFAAFLLKTSDFQGYFRFPALQTFVETFSLGDILLFTERVTCA